MSDADAHRDIMEGIVAAGRRMREWRDGGLFASITVRWEMEDKTMCEITCDGEDSIWVVAPQGSEPREVTVLVDDRSAK